MFNLFGGKKSEDSDDDKESEVQDQQAENEEQVEAKEDDQPKKVEESKEQKVGKFDQGDHMVTVLLQVGQQFVSASGDE